MAVYTLMIPVGFWDQLENKIIYYFSNKKRQIVTPRKRIINIELTYIERLKLNGLLTMTFFLCLLQFNTMFNFPVSNGIKKLVPHENKIALNLFNQIKKGKNEVRSLSTSYLGITGHGVFIDEHIRDYTMIYTLKYKDSYLPFYDEYGMPDDYLQAGSWINFNFRVNKPNVLGDVEGLKKGLVRYAAFWAFKNDVDLELAEFNIIKK
jgi:hypothetical protein